MNTPSDTPRTDTAFHEINVLHEVSHLIAFHKARDFARTLERELATLKTELSNQDERWEIKVSREMFAATTCIQSGEELALPAIWQNVAQERDGLRGQLFAKQEECERLRVFILKKRDQCAEALKSINDAFGEGYSDDELAVIAEYDEALTNK